MYVYNRDMQISELGEAGLVALIQETIESGGVAGDDGRVLLGIGDDGAMLRLQNGVGLVTTDHAVSGVHFLSNHESPFDIGWRTMAVNVSDISAMGGVPRFAVVALACPKETQADWVRDLYRGMAALCRETGVAIVGGDVSRAIAAAISVTLIGEPGLELDGQPCVFRRDTARVGDHVYVTGSLGGAAAGRAQLFGQEPDAERNAELVDAFLHPPLRTQAALALLAGGVRTGMDLSDGLVIDLTRLCTASGLSANIRAAQIPIHPLLQRFPPDEAMALGLGGGEDYELLLTAAPEVVASVGPTLGCALTDIGELVAGQTGMVNVQDADDQWRAPTQAGYTHF